MSYPLFLTVLVITLIPPQTWSSYKTFTPRLVGRHDIPTNIHLRDVTNCSFVVVNGFLKERCSIDNVEYFKCSYSDRYYTVTKSTCQETTFSRVCPNDTTFYQACGHNQCSGAQNLVKRRQFHDSLFGPDVAACGELVCQQDDSDYYVPGNSYRPELFDLAGKALRKGQLISSSTFKDETPIKCLNSIEGMRVDVYAKQVINASDQVKRKNSSCDNVCDDFFCEDEKFCNNMTIGISCMDRLQNKLIYVHPFQICDSYDDCRTKIDEKNCSIFEETCMTANMRLLMRAGLPFSSETVRHLSPRSKCSVPMERLEWNWRVCTDYRDQMNCTGSTISPLLCNVDGYLTTISEHVICRQLEVQLCDDGVENDCVDTEAGCRIHKHRLCDGFYDCRSGLDESDVFCKDYLPDSTISCVRRYSRDGKSIRIPQTWVLDGVTDCRNYLDENPAFWRKECGFGQINVYNHVDEDTPNCTMKTQFKCPGILAFLNLDRVCSGNALDNCDAEVCVTARKKYLKHINDKIKNKHGETKTTLFCLPGLYELENLAGKCTKIRLAHQKNSVGIPDIEVLTSGIFAESYIQCSEIFGELYVYLSCSGICGKLSQHCPLKPVGATLCLNYPLSQNVFSLSEDGTLALALDDGISYSKVFFPCGNGRCITFDKVCNLADDCGDFSDETKCSNNFKCNKSEEYIPLTRKCDGKFDCFDYTDECNLECTNHVTMFDKMAVKVGAWIFGILATVLNTFTLLHGFCEFRKLKTETAIINKGFVSLITFGDLLQGIFLLTLSIGEQFFNDSTCVTQYEWTKSSLCSGLGVLSTVGSLVSLYSMTILSLIRASKVKSMKRPREGISRKKRVLLAAAIFTIVIVSLVIAVFPLVAVEDFFVEKLNYDDNPLLVGAPTKVEHLKLIESYYGRIRIRDGFSKEAMPWNTLRTLVKGFFTNKEVVGDPIGFYGINGFCLFSYFVRQDSSFKWFSLSVLIGNLVCVAVIVVCYIVITIFAVKSSDSVAKNPQTEKNNKKLQRKVTVIILTDIFTWLPFIIVCIINYTELVDTSGWYSVFCVFFLPINSIINPIGIYDETVFTFITNIASKLRARFERMSDLMKRLEDAIRSNQQLPQEVIEMRQIPKDK